MLTGGFLNFERATECETYGDSRFGSDGGPAGEGGYGRSIDGL